MRLIELKYDGLGIARGVIEGTGGIYYTSFDSEYNRGWCTCGDYLYRKATCKHLIYLFMNLEVEKMVKKKDFDCVSTDSQIIDGMLGGGVPYSIVTGIYGIPMAGKSIFCYQMICANLAHNKFKTLYIDTEGIRQKDVRNVLNKFAPRFGITHQDIKDRFDFMTTLGNTQLKSYQMIFKLFGKIPKLEKSKGGSKVTPNFDITTPILDDKKLAEYSMIVIDSFSKPFKDGVVTVTQNLPARATLQEQLFGLLSDVAVKHNIAIMINHHTTRNPTTPFAYDYGNPTGGDSIIYNTKYVLNFWTGNQKMAKEKGWEPVEVRKVRLYRHPSEQLTGEWIPIRLRKDYGFCDK